MGETDTTATTQYYARLGLEFDPFAAGAMPDFFFVGAQRRFLVQRAVHALYFSGATVLLLGADGSGKTRTLDEIQHELKDLADISRIEATVLMNIVEIRDALVASFGLPLHTVNSNIDLLAALNQMRPADHDPQPILLAIDVAQLLAIDVLAECAALANSSGGRLRLLLAGEFDLATAWQQAEAGAAEILELAPLDRAEVADYVRTKLQAAGYREEQPLPETELDALFAQSGGNFAAINTLAPQWLARSPATSIAHRVKKLPVLHIVVIAALLAAVILLMLYRNHDDSVASVTATNTVELKNAALPNKAHEQNSIALELPKAAPAHESTAQAIEPPITKSAPNMPETTPAAVPSPNPQTVVPAKVEKAENKKSQMESTLSGDEQALLAMPAAHYVLQLMGAEAKITLDKFANGAGRGVKFYYYRTQLRGRPWFIVVAGPYSDKNAAQAALSKLPEPVRKQQPWARSIANVQADIRAHRGDR